MAFPSSPTNGQIYKKYKYNVNRWENMSIETHQVPNNGLIAHWKFDDVPQCPDNTATTAYSFTDVPLLWNQNLPTTNTFSQGIWTIIATGGNSGFYHGRLSSITILDFEIISGIWAIGLEGHHETLTPGKYKKMWKGNDVNPFILYNYTGPGEIRIKTAYIGDGNYSNTTTDVVNNYHSSLSSGIITIPGTVGNAIQFDGSSSIASFPQISVPDEWSIAVWVKKYSSTTPHGIISYYQYNNQGIFINESNQVVIKNYNPQFYQYSDAIPVSDNNWFHLVIKQSQESSIYKTRVWINAVEMSVSNSDKTVPTMGLSWNYIGQYKAYASGTASYQLNGALADFRIYNRALTTTEIKTLYSYNQNAVNIIN